MNALRQPEDRGASAVEYGLIVVAIAAVIVLAVVALGGLTLSLFEDTCSGIDAQVPSTAAC